MKIPETKMYRPNGNEKKIIIKHVILFFATLALAILAMHLFKVKITGKVILANAFMIYLVAMNLCGYDLYRNDEEGQKESH